MTKIQKLNKIISNLNKIIEYDVYSGKVLYKDLELDVELEIGENEIIYFIHPETKERHEDINDCLIDLENPDMDKWSSLIDYVLADDMLAQLLIDPEIHIIEYVDEIERCDKRDGSGRTNKGRNRRTASKRLRKIKAFISQDAKDVRYESIYGDDYKTIKEIENDIYFLEKELKITYDWDEKDEIEKTITMLYKELDKIKKPFLSGKINTEKNIKRYDKRNSSERTNKGRNKRIPLGNKRTANRVKRLKKKDLIKKKVRKVSIHAEKDSDAIRELKLYEENNSKIYERKQYMYKNLANKIAQEKYNSTKAIKMFDMLVTDIVKNYEKEFGDTFDKDVKKDLAKELRDEFEDTMLNESSDYFDKLYKQYQKEGQESFDKKIKKQIKASITSFIDFEKDPGYIKIMKDDNLTQQEKDLIFNAMCASESEIMDEFYTLEDKLEENNLSQQEKKDIKKRMKELDLIIKASIKAFKQINAFDQANVDELMLWIDNDESLYNIKMKVYEILLNDGYDERYAMELFIPIVEYVSDKIDWDIDEKDIKQATIELVEQFKSDNDITASITAYAFEEDPYYIKIIQGNNLTEEEKEAFTKDLIANYNDPKASFMANRKIKYIKGSEMLDYVFLTNLAGNDSRHYTLAKDNNHAVDKFNKYYETDFKVTDLTFQTTRKGIIEVTLKNGKKFFKPFKHNPKFWEGSKIKAFDAYDLYNSEEYSQLEEIDILLEKDVLSEDEREELKEERTRLMNWIQERISGFVLKANYDFENDKNYINLMQGNLSEKEKEVLTSKLIRIEKLKIITSRKPLINKRNKIKANREGDLIKVVIENIGKNIKIEISTNDNIIYLPKNSDINDVFNYFNTSLYIDLDIYMTTESYEELAQEFTGITENLEIGKQYTFDLKRYFEEDVVIYPKIEKPNDFMWLLGMYSTIYPTDTMMKDSGYENKTEYKNKLLSDFAKIISKKKNPILLKDEEKKYFKQKDIFAFLKGSKIKSRKISRINSRRIKAITRKDVVTKIGDGEWNYDIEFGEDLKGLDLSNLNLSDITFHYGDLSNVSFKNSNLRDCFFHNVDLKNVDFTDADTTGAEFRSCINLNPNLNVKVTYPVQSSRRSRRTARIKALTIKDSKKIKAKYKGYTNEATWIVMRHVFDDLSPEIYNKIPNDLNENNVMKFLSSQNIHWDFDSDLVDWEQVVKNLELARQLAEPYVQSSRKPSRRKLHSRRIKAASVKSLEKMILDKYPKTNIQLFDKSDKEDKAIDIGYIVPDPESNDFMGGSWGQLSHMLDDVVRWAFKNNYILVTTPDFLSKDKASFKGGKKKLIKLYKEHKFLLNRGKNQDYRFKETMIKVPKDKVYAEFKAFATLVASNKYNKVIFGGRSDLKKRFEQELKINADLIYNELAPRYKKQGMEAFLIKAEKILKLRRIKR